MAEGKRARRKRKVTFKENLDRGDSRPELWTFADYVDAVIRVDDTFSSEDKYRLRTLQDADYSIPLAARRLKISYDTLRSTVHKAVKLFRSKIE